MSDAIRVDSLKLKIKDAVLELSLDDARALRDALDGALPKPETQYVPYIAHTPTYPWWRYGFDGYTLCSTANGGPGNKATWLWGSSDGDTSLTASYH